MEGLAALLAQGVFVKQVFSHAILGRAHTAQVGHPVTQLLDGLDLLIQVVSLDKVTHLKGDRWRVIVINVQWDTA